MPVLAALLVASSWADEDPSQQAAAAAAPMQAEKARQAAQVELSEPVQEASPLPVVEDDKASPAVESAAVNAAEQVEAAEEPTIAPSVDLGQPVEEVSPQAVAEDEQASAAVESSAVNAAEQVEASEEPTIAPSVDLGEPVEEVSPLAVVEDAYASPAVESAAVEAAEQVEAAEEPTIAPSVDLGEPLTEAGPAASVAPIDGKDEAGPAELTQSEASALDELRSADSPASSATAVAATVVAGEIATEPASDAEERVEIPPLVMLGSEVAPGTSTRLSWSPSLSFEGIAVPTPVLVVNGANAGPVLCLTAAVHGDELNGIEIVRRVLYNLDAEKLSGTVVGVPIVNLQGFRRGSRYLPDRRDLNRFFPGDPRGSSAARIAHSFFNEVIGHCSALVDLHTGSFYRTNLPQLRADLRDEDVLELSQGFDGTVVLQSEGALGTLRKAAVNMGIPAVTLEAGEPMRLQEKEVNHGVKTIQSLLGKMGMVKKSSFWGEPEPVYYQSAWVRADQGGILFSEVGLGERVKKNEILGTVTDPITNVRTEIVSPYRGRVLGMALNQVVMPGFAAFRIGIQANEEEVIDGSKAEEMDISATLHTSQVEKITPKLPVVQLEEEFAESEGLEDSE